MPEERTCPTCGECFTPPSNRKNQVFCTRDCAYVGRKIKKEETAKERVDIFIESLTDIQIFDVLDGKMVSDARTDNYMNVHGVRKWNDGKKKFKIIVYE